MNTTQDNSPLPGNGPNGSPPERGQHVHRRCAGKRGGALRLLAFLAVGGVGFMVGQASAHEGGPGFFGGPMMGGMGPGFDPAGAEVRIEKMAKHLAVEADATPAQQEKLALIARATAKDLAGTRQRMHEHRQQTMAALAAPAIDKTRLEALRGEQMKDAEAMSKRITQAMGEAAEVLTPEQRKKLAEHMAERRERGGHGARGPWGGRG